MTRLWMGLVAIVASSVAASGCLLKAVGETWYVQPSGEVTWQVLERDVRSDAETPSDRDAEELNYLTNVRSRNHPVARGLVELGATSVDVRLLHASQPYTVITSGAFRSVEELGQRLAAIGGASSSSTVERTPMGFRWSLTLRDPGTGLSAPLDDDVAEVLNHLDALDVVLVDGRFTDARNFDVSSDQRVASGTHLEAVRDVSNDVSSTTFMLAWTNGR